MIIDVIPGSRFKVPSSKISHHIATSLRYAIGVTSPWQAACHVVVRRTKTEEHRGKPGLGFDQSDKSSDLSAATDGLLRRVSQGSGK